MESKSSEAARMKEFVEYFAELDRLGISYSIEDMLAKSDELELPIPDYIAKERGLMNWKHGIDA